MSWGTELWDQFDAISDHTQRGINALERYIHFLKERSSIEQEYAEKLKKLVRNYQPKKKEDTDENQFSWARGFQDTIKEVYDLAGQHEVISENMQSQVMKEALQLAQELKQDRKKYLQEGVRLRDQDNKSKAQLEKSKKTYEKSFREAEKALEAYRKADADINLSRAEVEKHRNTMMLKGQQCEKCKNDYAAQLQVTNTAQSEYYKNLLPQVFQQLQSMEENRINRFKGYIGKCAEIERNVIPIINTCIDGMTKASESINAPEDSKILIDKYKSGLAIPADIPFDDLSNNSAPPSSNNHTPKSQTTGTIKEGRRKRNIIPFFNSKGDENKEDIDKLPKYQRQKAYQKKIDELKKYIARDTAEREGMLKMKDVYVQNPALGDPNSLDKKIEENAQKLDNLNQELRKYQTMMAEVTGQKGGSSESLATQSDTSEANVSTTSLGGGSQAQTAVYDSDFPPPPQSSIPDPDEEFIEEEPHPEFDDDESFPVIGTCRALYRFDANNESSVTITEGEEMDVTEQDRGDGWTRVKKKDGMEGFVPTSYIQCHFYDQDEV